MWSPAFEVSVLRSVSQWAGIFPVEEEAVDAHCRVGLRRSGGTDAAFAMTPPRAASLGVESRGEGQGFG